ncbi:hypothetical protein [Endozoicomonas numazuensis]|nr:hypothetical protein [Endozoicomonas numazuensis]
MTRKVYNPRTKEELKKLFRRTQWGKALKEAEDKGLIKNHKTW